MEFGPGSQLAAQCAPQLPPPEGWRPWVPEANGPIPDALAARAHAIAADPAVALGATENFPLSGVTALIRIEPRVWGFGPDGALTQGCFRVGAIFLPEFEDGETVTPPTASGMTRTEKIVGGLTIASLTVGIIATLASWGK